MLGFIKRSSCDPDKSSIFENGSAPYAFCYIRPNAVSCPHYLLTDCILCEVIPALYGFPEFICKHL